jgi:hypothetical protein
MKIKRFEIVKQIDSESYRWSGIISSGSLFILPIDGTYSTQTNMCHLSSKTQETQTLLPHFDIAAAVKPMFAAFSF